MNLYFWMEPPTFSCQGTNRSQSLRPFKGKSNLVSGELIELIVATIGATWLESICSEFGLLSKKKHDCKLKQIDAAFPCPRLFRTIASVFGVPIKPVESKIRFEQESAFPSRQIKDYVGRPLPTFSWRPSVGTDY